MPPGKIAFRLCSRCWGVMVAATPALARALTNSTARSVVMCSNTTRKAGKRSSKGASTAIDEVRFTVEDIHLGLRRFAVHQQAACRFLPCAARTRYTLAMSVTPAVRMRGRAGRVELDAVNESAGAWRVRSPAAAVAFGQIQGQQRLESRYRRAAPPDRARDRRAPAAAVVIARLQIGHHDGATESLAR